MYSSTQDKRGSLPALRRLYGLFFLGLSLTVAAFLLAGCAEKGGTVTFTNDTDGNVTVGIAVYSSGSVSPTAETLAAGKKISKSLDEDGKYAVSGTYMVGYTAHVISKTGDLSGGDSVDLKASDF